MDIEWCEISDHYILLVLVYKKLSQTLVTGDRDSKSLDRETDTKHIEEHVITQTQKPRNICTARLNGYPLKELSEHYCSPLVNPYKKQKVLHSFNRDGAVIATQWLTLSEGV